MMRRFILLLVVSLGSGSFMVNEADAQCGLRVGSGGFGRANLASIRADRLERRALVRDVRRQVFALQNQQFAFSSSAILTQRVDVPIVSTIPIVTQQIVTAPIVTTQAIEVPIVIQSFSTPRAVAIMQFR